MTVSSAAPLAQALVAVPVLAGILSLLLASASSKASRAVSAVAAVAGFAISVALFAVLLAAFMWRALMLSLRPPEERRELALAYLITIALTAIMSFQQWTFMEPRIYPMGLWILAFVAAEALRGDIGPPEPEVG
jgi:hypothetical protein